MKALRAVGLLADFSDAGVLEPADVHVAQRLGVLAGESDDRVLLAVALTVRGTRNGSVVLDLDEAACTIAPDTDEASDAVELPWPETAGWVAACSASALVTGAAGGPPLRMVGARLWLDRYWRQEVQVADDLLRRSADRPDDIDRGPLDADLDELFDDAAADQRQAVAVAATSRVAVIAGGPGTGKTTTVAQLITVLLRRLGPGLRVALAAPTGKAAARLEEAVHSARGNLTDDDRAALARLSASTLHRLLGWRPGTSSRFRHDRDNHLPFDVVMVDESSMVSLTLMARLLEALGPATRLVLVGDPDQLASVEAGAVLGDLVDADSPDARLRESVVRLRTVYRFAAGGPIAELAALVRAGRGDDALALLRSGADGLVFAEVADDETVSGPALAAVQSAVVAHESALIAAAASGDVEGALDALDRHRLLCAHRGGPRGVRHWSEHAERWLAPSLDVRGDGRYAGQPLLVTSNDYDVGLYNGDTGVVVRHGDGLLAAFARGGTPTVLPLVRLGEVRPLHAMTVHRAQGSQFAEVTVLLPLAASPLATRQTFYTAITRAASSVRLIGSAESVLACVERPIARATGLRSRLSGHSP
ncbi:exodeoxyribonuclease V subunit alpha [uncultured Jatrophihabitans sp.]|uniref:exodeoxyribonuclease V subunit alpha n=1 Tax=uncultured Jatrophihabitans sp. TaxID=1610747 RepID=UPI0035CBA1AF